MIYKTNDRDPHCEVTAACQDWRFEPEGYTSPQTGRLFGVQVELHFHEVVLPSEV